MMAAWFCAPLIYEAIERPKPTKPIGLAQAVIGAGIDDIVQAPSGYEWLVQMMKKLVPNTLRFTPSRAQFVTVLFPNKAAGEMRNAPQIAEIRS
jgi:hypothetical protein